MSESQRPICGEAIKLSAELFNIIEELERAKSRRGYLKTLIVDAQKELAKEYGMGYITRKSVKKSKFPIFRSLERGKDYNLERNYPDLAGIVNEYFDLGKRIKELEAKRIEIERFLNTAITVCVPAEYRNVKRANKERKEAKAIAYVSNLEDELADRCEDGDEEACAKLTELEECVKKGFRVKGKRIICGSKL